MPDSLTSERRSNNMARIRSRDTTPEMAVRKLLHRLGYRFRLHRRDLPGKPDIVFPSRKKVVFVHGCFWHQHPECREGRLPGTNVGYWAPKLHRNVERDKQAQEELAASGWDVLVLWECQVPDEGTLTLALRSFLDPQR